MYFEYIVFMVITGWPYELIHWLMKSREKFSHLRQGHDLYRDNLSQRTPVTAPMGSWFF